MSTAHGQQHSFSNHEGMFLRKYWSFWDRKMSRPRKDACKLLHMEAKFAGRCHCLSQTTFVKSFVTGTIYITILKIIYIYIYIYQHICQFISRPQNDSLWCKYLFEMYCFREDDLESTWTIHWSWQLLRINASAQSHLGDLSAALRPILGTE